MICTRLPADRTSVPAARHFVRDQLFLAGHAVWPAELLVSELAANAIEHGDGDITISVTLDPVRIAVTDHGGAASDVVVVHGAADGERGRGMQLVDALATRWGVLPLEPGGKTGWFEVERPTRRTGPAGP